MDRGQVTTMTSGLKLAITIDTEEDSWGDYSSVCGPTTNIERIPKLQLLFDEFDVKPTYLVTYPVTKDENAVSILRQIHDNGRCEIGSHLHPWNTPPIDESSGRESMLCNILPDLQEKKLRILHDAIKTNMGVAPTSFRAGRWGYNQGLNPILSRLGYTVDSSIMPFTNWSQFGGPDFSGIPLEAPGLHTETVRLESGNWRLTEFPVTVAFLQRNFAFCEMMWRLLDSTRLRNFHLKGVLHRLHLLNKASLSPEISKGETMIHLTRVLMDKGFAFFNMFFHSTSLKAGLSPFVRTRGEEEELLSRIRQFLVFSQSAGLETVTLTQAALISLDERPAWS